MTAQQNAEQPAIDPGPRQVQPRSNSRLAQLHAEYAAAKAAADGANEKLKAITDAIKVELTNTDPNQRRFELVPANGVEAPALRLTYTETWRFDSTKFKKDDPETYVRYAKKSGSWRLAAAKAGEE